MLKLPNFVFSVTMVGATFLGSFEARSQENRLNILERLASADPKPFVVIEAIGDGSVNRGQGVLISDTGHVLSAGHLSWDKVNGEYSNKFRVGMRGTGKGLPGGTVHIHKTVFSDREDAAFFEHYYPADLQRQNGSRFIGDGDLALFTVKADGAFPSLDFYSEKKPTVRMGDVFHLCHFNFPNNPADPTFLINPVEVVGVAQTSNGIQYLAKGYYRVGSSGGAIIKDGRLIGIQSAAYTVNASDIGEIPMGLISFQLVWSDLFREQLTSHEKTNDEK